MVSFIAPELAQTIFEGEPEFHLWLLIAKGIFGKDRLETDPWMGDAEDLKRDLCAEISPVRVSAAKLLNSVHLSTIGTWLRQLHGRFPNEVVQKRKANERTWVIQPPAK